jgi:hypothetical protein
MGEFVEPRFSEFHSTMTILVHRHMVDKGFHSRRQAAQGMNCCRWPHSRLPVDRCRVDGTFRRFVDLGRDGLEESLGQEELSDAFEHVKAGDFILMSPPDGGDEQFRGQPAAKE